MNFEPHAPAPREPQPAPREPDAPAPLITYLDVVLVLLAAPIMLLIGVPAVISADAWAGRPCHGHSVTKRSDDSSLSFRQPDPV